MLVQYSHPKFPWWGSTSLKQHFDLASKPKCGANKFKAKSGNLNLFLGILLFFFPCFPCNFFKEKRAKNAEKGLDYQILPYFEFEKVELERDADNSGREFLAWIFFLGGGGPETLEKQGRKIHGKNSPSKFAEKFAGQIFLRFASTPIPLCRTSGSRHCKTSGFSRAQSSNWGGELQISRDLADKTVGVALHMLLSPWFRPVQNTKRYVAPIGAFFCTSVSPINGD